VPSGRLTLDCVENALLHDDGRALGPRSSPFKRRRHRAKPLTWAPRPRDVLPNSPPSAPPHLTLYRWDGKVDGGRNARLKYMAPRRRHGVDRHSRSTIRVHRVLHQRPHRRPCALARQLLKRQGRSRKACVPLNKRSRVGARAGTSRRKKACRFTSRTLVSNGGLRVARVSCDIRTLTNLAPERTPAQSTIQPQLSKAVRLI